MKKLQNWLLRWIWRSLAIFFALVFLYQVWVFAHICWWVKFNPSTSAFMETRLEILQDKSPKAALQHQWVSYAKISDNLKSALIAAEDASFVDHEGFDWEAYKRLTKRISRRARHRSPSTLPSSASSREDSPCSQSAWAFPG